MVTGSYRIIELETIEETRLLYNTLQAAIFRYRNKADHVAFSIPLSRVENIQFDDMLDVSGLFYLLLIGRQTNGRNMCPVLQDLINPRGCPPPRRLYERES